MTNELFIKYSMCGMAGREHKAVQQLHMTQLAAVRPFDFQNCLRALKPIGLPMPLQTNFQ